MIKKILERAMVLAAAPAHANFFKFKKAAVLLAGAAMLSAAPAQAGWVYTWYAPNGQITGVEYYCDSGELLFKEGWEGPLLDVHWEYIPC